MWRGRGYEFIKRLVFYSIYRVWGVNADAVTLFQVIDALESGMDPGYQSPQAKQGETLACARIDVEWVGLWFLVWVAQNEIDKVGVVVLDRTFMDVSHII